MAKNIYIHVGTVKTGTSYLQEVFYKNSDFFEKNNLFYPTMRSKMVDSGRFANGNLLRDKTINRKLNNIINESPAENIIFSEEGLFSDFKYILPNLKNDHNIKIIAYIRPSVELISSWAGEFSKPYNALNGELVDINTNLPALANRYDYELRGFLDSVDHIGSENVIIQFYNKKSFYQRGLLKDILSGMMIHIADEKLDSLNYVQDFINETPSRKYCDISAIAYSILKKIDRLYIFNENLVNILHDSCLSGDCRKITETLSFEQISLINDKLDWLKYELCSRFSTKMLDIENNFENNGHESREKIIEINNNEIEFLMLLQVIYSNLIESSGKKASEYIGSPVILNDQYVFEQIDITLAKLEQLHKNICDQKSELLTMRRLAIS